MSGMRCDICLQFLIPESDSYKWITVNGKKVMGYGRITFVHVKKCVQAPPPAYEKEDEKETVAWEKKCGECKKMFNPKKRANGTQVVCGPECRKARVTRKRAKSDAKRGKYWKLRVLKKLNLPTRECVECHKLFTISTKFSRKQIICSSSCRAIRLARRTKESRAA